MQEEASGMRVRLFILSNLPSKIKHYITTFTLQTSCLQTEPGKSKHDSAVAKKTVDVRYPYKHHLPPSQTTCPLNYTLPSLQCKPDACLSLSKSLKQTLAAQQGYKMYSNAD